MATRRSNVMTTTKRRALILISSGRQLPLAEPAEVTSISTGFFLVEMAQMLKEFETDYEFTFATPDGNAPQLDINGMALSMHYIEKIGAKTIPLRRQQRRRSFTVNGFRQRHPADAFTFADFDFIHAPGGHAPMVDFRDNPWLGETLHVARENGVTISLICHAPIAVTSTRQRVDAQGSAYLVSDNPFLAATISTVPKIGERFALRFLYPRVPGKKTRLPYFVDVAIKEAGFTVTSSPNISAPKLAYEPSVRLLTGNGPQAIDQQAAKLRSVLTSTRTAQRASSKQLSK